MDMKRSLVAYFLLIMVAAVALVAGRRAMWFRPPAASHGESGRR